MTLTAVDDPTDATAGDATTDVDATDATGGELQARLYRGRPEFGNALDGLRVRMLAAAGGLAPRTIGRYRLGRVIDSERSVRCTRPRTHSSTGAWR